MTCKKLLVVVVLLSAILGVDAISEKRTKKLYRKAGKWQRKLRDVWALLGVKPFLVQPGEEGDECVLKSKVEEDYVLKATDLFTQADVDAAVAAAVAAKDDEIAAIGRGIVANYMSNDDVAANYVLKTDVEANYVPKADVEADYWPKAYVEAFFTSNEVVVATYGCSSITPFRCGE